MLVQAFNLLQGVCLMREEEMRERARNK